MNSQVLSFVLGGLLATTTALAACSKDPDSSGTGGASSTGGFEGTGGDPSESGGGGSVGLGGFDGTGGEPMGQGGDCGSVALHQRIIPGNIVVVFDQSNSMGTAFSDDDGGSGKLKWQVAEDALVASVQPIEDILNLGAIFFPTSKCAVAAIDASPQLPIVDGPTFLARFQDHFSSPDWVTIGTTPLAEALGAADAALPDPSPLEGARAVVVITDGKPTCDDTQDTVLAPVQSLAARGIKSYAIGLPGSDDAASLLNAIAAAGGTGTYFNPNSPSDLQDALAAIASKTVDQCTIVLDPAPVNRSKVYLIVKDATDPDGIEIPRSDSGDGWSLGDDGITATLHGAVCDNAKNGVYTDITFVYGCPSLPR